MNRVPIYILAGGRSSRFGSDKARASVGGKALIQHVADLFDSVAASVTVVADRDGKYADLGLRTIKDIFPGLGPLAGLHAALSDLPSVESWLMLSSCDALVVRSHWLMQLLERRTERCDAVAFRSRWWQPMPGLYGRTAWSVVCAQIESRNRSMQRLLDQLSVAHLPMPDDWPENWQVNRPEHLIGFTGDKESS